MYIVENEMVFSYLVERLKGGKHSESCPAEDGEARAGEGRAGYQENMLEELVGDIGGTDNGEMKPALGR